MARLLRYAVCDDPDEWGDAPVYEHLHDAEQAAESRGECVVELEYEYVGSSIVADYREEGCSHPNAVESDPSPPPTWYCPDCGEYFIAPEEE